MLYFKRKTDAYLDEWKRNPSRTPLIIEGARQIGKTCTIRNFAKSNYSSVVEINFAEMKKFKGITENGYSAESITNLISFLDPSMRFIPRKTLIFFDEIQEYPDIATCLKFFREDGRYDVICSGSMLGIKLNEVNSISVGNKCNYTMRSMDFEEYLWAKGYTGNVIDNMLAHMLDGEPFSKIEHDVFTRLFLEYCIVGGMPEVIKSYITSNLYTDILSKQRTLTNDYEDDMIKYAEGLDKMKLIRTFRSIPSQLAKANKKFQYSKIAHGARSGEYLGCVDWLENYGIINIAHCLNYPELPLKGNENYDAFKVYVSDTGLLVSMLEDEAYEDLRVNRNLGVYKGALYENFAAEALVKQDYALYYYSKPNSTLEQDFFIRSTNELIPLDINSGNTQKKSIRTLIQSPEYEDIRHGIKFISGNIGFIDPIYTFPHYCMFLLKRFMKTQNIFG